MRRLTGAAAARTVAAASLLAALWAMPATAQDAAQNAPQGGAQGGAPTEGATLYLEGSALDATMLGGRLRVPGQRFACGGCHGADAEGGVEGGEDFPAIGWERLADADRPGGPYDEALFARALRDGIAPGGRTLSQAMPRYAASDAQVAALISYLREVGDNQRQGLRPGLVRVGITGASAEEQAGLIAAAQRFNAAGGAFGRGLQLVRGGKGDTFIDAAHLTALLAPRIAAAEDRLGAGAGGRGVLRLGQPAPQARPAGLRSVGLRPDHAAAAAAAGLPAAAMPAYLRGLMLGEALIACGRDLRRACVDTALAGSEVAGYLRLYDAGPAAP